MSVAWVGAGIAAVGVVSSAVSANNAANAQKSAANSANNLQQSEFDQTRADQQPYRDAGYAALNRMQDLLGLSGNTTAQGYGLLTKPFDASSVASDPGYQFGLTTGINTAQNSAAARGGLYSGATLKALTQFGNDYATTKFDDAFNRDQTTKNAEYNKLAGVSGTGQVATNQVDSAGQTNAATQGSNLIGAGNARGAADIATGSAVQNGINQGGAWWLKYGSTPGSSYTGGGLTSQAATNPGSYLSYTDPSWSSYTGG